jgi:hypothetical protein
MEDGTFSNSLYGASINLMKTKDLTINVTIPPMNIIFTKSQQIDYCNNGFKIIHDD